MPGGDRTGPMGAGAMTGRGAGYCAGFGMPGYANPMPGRGASMGFGRRGGFGGGGRGRRNMFYATGLPGWARTSVPVANTAPQAEGEELAYLKGQAKQFSEALKDINRRIDELQNKQEG